MPIATGYTKCGMHQRRKASSYPTCSIYSSLFFIYESTSQYSSTISFPISLSFPPSVPSKLLGGTATRHQSGASSHYNRSLGPEKRSWNPRSLGPRDVGFPKGPFKSPEFFSCWKSNQPTTKTIALMYLEFLWTVVFFRGNSLEVGHSKSFQVEGFRCFFWGVGKLWYFCQVYMGVSKNSGTLKWMVYDGKFIKNGRFGGTPIIGNAHKFVIPSIGKARWGSDVSRHALLQQRSIDIPEKMI